MIEVWAPAYSNKSGVKKLSGHLWGMQQNMFRKGNGYGVSRMIGRDVFLTADEARAEAEKRRLARIAALERQLAKLNALSHAS